MGIFAILDVYLCFGRVWKIHVIPVVNHRFYFLQCLFGTIHAFAAARHEIHEAR